MKKSNLIWVLHQNLKLKIFNFGYMAILREIISRRNVSYLSIIKLFTYDN